MLITYYTRLGIPENATQDDIREAYLRLSKEYDLSRVIYNLHNRDDEIGRFVKIHKAYIVLSDPQRRAKYDNDLWEYRTNAYLNSKKKCPTPPTTTWGSIIHEIKNNKYIFVIACEVIVASVILIILFPNSLRQSDSPIVITRVDSLSQVIPADIVPNKNNNTSSTTMTDERRKEISKILGLDTTKNTTQSKRRNFHTVVSSDVNKQPTTEKIIVYKVPEPKSLYEGNRLHTEYSPYIGRYNNYYDDSSLNSIKFNNGSQYDAIVFLIDDDYNIVIRHNYIRSGDCYTMAQLPEGRYKMKVYQGKNWNPEKAAHSSMPLGKFDNDEIFSLTTKRYDFEVPSSDSENYVEYSITLHKVIGGNTRTKTISRDEMFNM